MYHYDLVYCGSGNVFYVFSGFFSRALIDAAAENASGSFTTEDFWLGRDSDVVDWNGVY